MIVVGAVLIGAGLFLTYLWDIIRPIPWQPHEPYRPPGAEDANRSQRTGSHDSRWRGLMREGIRRLVERQGHASPRR
jgi:hypothetical protein